MKRFFTLSILFIGSVLISNAQPSIQWQQSYGGTQVDGMETSNGGRDHIQQTTDGGFIIAATSNSNDGDVTGHNGSIATSDIWVFKIDSLGSIEWQDSYGGTQDEKVRCIQLTSDGGYILAGTTNSPDGDVTGWHGLNPSTNDVWIVKLDSVGNIEWEHAFGGTDDERGESVIQTTDGGYVFTALTYSTDGDVSGSHGSQDVWMVKLNNAGVLMWQKCFGGSSAERPTTVKQTPDNGFVFTGRTTSGDGDAVGNPDPSFLGSVWVVKTDSVGNLQWQKSYGGSGWEDPGDILLTADGGYLVLSPSSSNDGDVSGNHGTDDWWLFKINSSGTILWQNCYGGSFFDMPSDLTLTADNGFVATGFVSSNDGNVSGYHGANDMWVIKGDSTGALQWAKCLGGSEADFGKTILLTTDGGFMVCGESSSNDGDVSGHHGSTTVSDVWLVKLSPLPVGLNEPTESIASLAVYPNPTEGLSQISFELLQRDHVQIDLLDISGRVVRNISNSQLYSGTHLLDINTSDLDKGMYLVRLSTAENVQTVRIIKNY